METSPAHAIFLAGPTAAGKSEIALELASRIGGEIISVDSMQVYRGMDIGTAKPTPEERQRVRHHLIDVVDLDQGFDAAQFVRLAGEAVKDIESRGRIPIFCGGTGLYFKAFLEGLRDAPPSDPRIRTELNSLPLNDLLQELAERDPLTFQTIDQKNPRRVIRALEVIRITGQPFSKVPNKWENSLKFGKNRGNSGNFAFGITRPPSELTSRIHHRVDDMFRKGLVAETEALLHRSLRNNPTALQALGYRQVVEHLQGERSLADTIELVKIRTRQFAKRQLTWFRNQMHLEWITLSGDVARDLAPLFACSERGIVAHSPSAGQNKSQ